MYFSLVQFTFCCCCNNGIVIMGTVGISHIQYTPWQIKQDSLWNPKHYTIRTAEPNPIPLHSGSAASKFGPSYTREHKFHLTCSQASNLATDLAGHRLIYHTLSLRRLLWRSVKPSLMAGNKSGTGSIEPRPAS